MFKFHRSICFLNIIHPNTVTKQLDNLFGYGKTKPLKLANMVCELCLTNSLNHFSLRWINMLIIFPPNKLISKIGKQSVYGLY